MDDRGIPFLQFDDRASQSVEPQRHLVRISAAALHGEPVPSREFHVDGVLPAKTVTLLSGDGGTGKSLLALQLSVATVLGKPWVGLPVRQGRVLYLSAEDDLDEIHRRLADIAADCDARLSDLEGLSLLPLAGEDAVLGAPTGRGNNIAPTPLWRALEREVDVFRPSLVVLDTLADLFAGAENERVQARQFIGMLRGLALRHRLTVLLLSHPSQAGIASGTGTSGSTGWSNSVRSRIYLQRALVRDESSRAESEPDPDLRILTTKKSNYGRTGQEIRIRWQSGVLRPEENARPGMFEQAARDQRADELFLRLVSVYRAEGRNVSASRSPSYAPTQFAKDKRAEGLSKTVLEAAMNRAFEAGRICVEEHGPPSKRSSRLVATGL